MMTIRLIFWLCSSEPSQRQRRHQQYRQRHRHIHDTHTHCTPHHCASPNFSHHPSLTRFRSQTSTLQVPFRLHSQAPIPSTTARPIHILGHSRLQSQLRPQLQSQLQPGSYHSIIRHSQIQVQARARCQSTAHAHHRPTMNRRLWKQTISRHRSTACRRRWRQTTTGVSQRTDNRL